VCVFASSETLLVSETRNESHPSYPPLVQAHKILKGARNASGARFQIVPIPLPEVPSITAEEAAAFATAEGTITRAEGTLMAPSYANLYIINDAVVVPTYGVPTDNEALRIIEECFPGRNVVPFQSREFLLGGGAIHCLTKEIPAASGQG
jgi:agmatine deiminase